MEYWSRVRKVSFGMYYKLDKLGELILMKLGRLGVVSVSYRVNSLS